MIPTRAEARHIRRSTTWHTERARSWARRTPAAQRAVRAVLACPTSELAIPSLPSSAGVDAAMAAAGLTPRIAVASMALEDEADAACGLRFDPGAVEWTAVVRFLVAGS